MLHRKIRTLRESRRLTQVQVGKAIEVPQRTYAYYETGQRVVTPKVLVSLANFYGITTDFLLGVSDAPQAAKTPPEAAKSEYPSTPLPRVKELRLSENVSKEEIAAFLGLNTSEYERFEAGDMEIPLFLIMGIAEYYGVSLDYLTGVTAVRAPYPQK